MSMQCPNTVLYNITDLLQYVHIFVLFKDLYQAPIIIIHQKIRKIHKKNKKITRNIVTFKMKIGQHVNPGQNPTGQNPTLTKPHRTKPHPDKTPSVIFS